MSGAAPWLPDLLARVRARAGLAYAADRAPFVAGAVERAAARVGEPDAGRYARQVAAGHRELQPLIDELAVGEGAGRAALARRPPVRSPRAR